jgi:hypothetical protein
VVVPHDGYSVVTSTVASDSDLLQIRGVARMCHPDADHVNAALPTSTSYLKLVDVPFFTMGDTCITPDGVMSQIGKSGFASLVVLQTPARVVHDSPKSDTCTVYLNVVDSVSGARAKGLVRKTVQFGQYTSYFRAARANPGSPLCSWCWRWGHPSSACRADRVLAQNKLRIHPYALIGHPTVGPATPNTPRTRKNISEHQFAPPKQLRVLRIPSHYFELLIHYSPCLRTLGYSAGPPHALPYLDRHNFDTCAQGY